MVNIVDHCDRFTSSKGEPRWACRTYRIFPAEGSLNRVRCPLAQAGIAERHLPCIRGKFDSRSTWVVLKNLWRRWESSPPPNHRLLQLSAGQPRLQISTLRSSNVIQGHGTGTNIVFPCHGCSSTVWLSHYHFISISQVTLYLPKIDHNLPIH